MDSWGTILLGYGLVAGTIVAYAMSVIGRGRAIGARLGLDREAREDGDG